MSTPEDFLRYGRNGRTDRSTKYAGVFDTARPTHIIATVATPAHAYVVYQQDPCIYLGSAGVIPATRKDVVYVPADLARRGIAAVTETRRPASSSSACCRVPGCSIRHSSHYCNVCSKWDVSHRDEDCPLYKRRDYTKF